MTADVRGTHVALIEDDPIMGESLVQRLTLEGCRVSWARTGAEGIELLARERPDFVISDIRLPDMSGEEVFTRSMPHLGGTPIVFVTAFGAVEQAVRLVRAGADDYLAKPFSIDLMLERIADLGRRPRGKAAAPAPDLPPEEGFALSEATRRVEAMLRRLAAIDSTVLLAGETGSGKEVAARFLHAASPGRDRPFVAVNCAAIPAELMDSQVFGHEKGSFTGAVDRHRGFAERAEDGVLFLDEVAELPLAVQAKLLRILQERRFTRVGGTAELPFRARLVCATNADLGEQVRRGTFREDLYYRINVIEVLIPPLRERKEEILPLARRFAAEVAARFGGGATDIDPAAEAALLDHEWRGNVRELRNRVERAVALSEGDRLGVRDLFPERALAPEPAETLPTLAEVRDGAERRHIQAALRETGGRVQRAAELLGVSRTTLWEKMRRLGIEGTAEEG